MSRKKGFTLLELLVAAAVTAGLSVILAASLSSLLSAFGQRNKTISYVAASQSAIDTISNMISTSERLTIKQFSGADAAIIMRMPANSSGQEYDMLCVDTTNGLYKLTVFSLISTSGSILIGGKDIVDYVGANLNSCTILGASSVIPSLASTIKQKTLFDAATTLISHLYAWPVWSDTAGQDYSASNPPAVRYQIVGNSKSVDGKTRASDTTLYPFVFQTSVLTNGATHNRTVGP